MKHPILLLIGILIMGCGTQKQVSLKQENGSSELVPGSTMVLCLSSMNEFREPFEKEMKLQLEFHGVHAETSTKYIPSNLDDSETSKKNLIEIVKSLPEKGFDRLLISALSNVEEAILETNGNSDHSELYHFETNLYQLDKKDYSLIWSICLCIYDYQLPLITIQDFVMAIVSKLEEDGIIKGNVMEDLKLYVLEN